MQLKILTICDIAKDVKEFTLVHPHGETLPVFTPGAHIEVTLKGTQRDYIRCYSLTSDPEDLSRYRIAVLRVPWKSYQASLITVMSRSVMMRVKRIFVRVFHGRIVTR